MEGTPPQRRNSVAIRMMDMKEAQKLREAERLRHIKQSHGLSNDSTASRGKKSVEYLTAAEAANAQAAERAAAEHNQRLAEAEGLADGIGQRRRTSFGSPGSAVSPQRASTGESGVPRPGPVRTPSITKGNTGDMIRDMEARALADSGMTTAEEKHDARKRRGEGESVGQEAQAQAEAESTITAAAALVAETAIEDEEEKNGKEKDKKEEDEEEEEESDTAEVAAESRPTPEPAPAPAPTVSEKSLFTHRALATLLSQAPDSVHFMPGYSTLADKSSEFLERTAEVLREANYRVRIEGHINTVKDNGTVLANDDPKIRVYEDCTGMELSQRRADAVVARLVALGVDSALLEAVGKGGDAPIYRDKANLARNRRVEMHIVTDE